MKLNLISILLVSCFAAVPAGAQGVLSLDSCRAMALRNNKSIGIARLKQQTARYTTKAARTQYLPKVDAVGGYVFTSREISLLNDKQKESLTHIGSNTSSQLGGEITSFISGLAQQGILTPEQAQHLGNMFNKVGTSLGEALNHSGQRIVDALNTDARNVFMGSVMLRQPIYMGGAIVAANKMAKLNEELMDNSLEASTQGVLYNTDQAYWTVVSLKHKKKLAESFLGLVTKLDDDVQKMIKEGVATRADGLKVAVKKNEAEMTLTQADDGLSLARMLLNQLCGLPLDSVVALADENKENLVLSGDDGQAETQDAAARPELRMLQNAVELSRQSTNIVRAAYLPQVALTAGYLVSNPNVYNGFENKFAGVWNIGVMVRIPVWNWSEGRYKTRSSRIATNIAELELSDTREKIALQVSQSSFRVKEARKKLAMAAKNVENADENLRCADLGFREGVMQTTDVMEAQTAWLQAQSQKIDAEIDVKLSQVNLKKALGVLK